MTALDRAMMLVPRGPSVLPDELLNRRLRTVEDVHFFFQTFITPAAPVTAGANNSASEHKQQQQRAHSAPARTPPFKFVYCAKVDSGLSFRPYDLIVVARGQQPVNHYVVSPTAVVHVVPGSAESDVVLITDWLKQSKQFDALRKITFFKHYLKKKIMKVWLQNISVAKFQQNRAKLGKRLFLSKSTFASSTLNLRKLAFDMRLVQKIDVNGKLPPPPGKSQFAHSTAANSTTNTNNNTLLQSTTGGGANGSGGSDLVKGEVIRVSRNAFPLRLIYFPETRPQWGYTAAQFLEAQQSHHLRVCSVLQRITEEIVTALTSVVDYVTQCAAVIPDINTVPQLEEYLSIDTNVKPGVGTLHKQERDLERQQRKRALKRRMIEYDFLQPWVRLVDSMVAEELFLNLITTFDTFAKHLDLPSIALHRELRISFQVCCIFEGVEPLRFTPCVDEVLQLVEGFVQDTVRKVGNLVRCVEMKEFRSHFFRNPTPTPLPQLCSDYAPFSDACVERIRKAIRRDFLDGLDKAKSYEACRQCQHFVHDEWVAEYKNWPERAMDKNKETCLQETEIKKFISKVLKFRGELSRMSNKHCGILSINIEPLTTELMQNLDAVQNDIKTSLLALASRRVNEVGKQLESNIQMLKFPPLELRDFSEWIERTNRVEKDAKELLQECAEVESLYVLAEDHGFDCPQAQKDKRERTVGSGKGGEPLRVQFSDAIAAAKSFREAHVDEVKQQLTVAVMDTVGVLENITDELRNGEYKEATHSSSLILSKLHGVHNNLQSLKAKREALNGYANLLGAMEPGWEEFKTANDVYDKKSDLWNAVARWEERRSYWNRTPVSQLDGEKIKEEMTELFQKAHKLNKADPDSVTERLLGGITVEKSNMAVMVELCNPALKEEHWLKIFDGIGKRLPPPDARTLETLRTFGAYQHADLINSISGVATGEYSLVKQIQKIAQVWEAMEFVLIKNRETDANCILGGVDEIMLLLEDHQVQVQTCLASRYVGGIRQMVEDWDTKLQLVRDVIDEWTNVQKSWMYLEFIFSSDDIKKQLPEESKMFAQIDKTYRQLMTKSQANNNVTAIATEEGLLINLKQSNVMLDKIQKRLEDYLETKRVAFPRFYFLSNDELLSILSDVRNPTAVQPHLQKCFDNIKELTFDDSHTISAMKSTEGEVVQFPDTIKVVGGVENWLNDIERMMRRTLYETMGKCVEAYPRSVRNEWYFEFPAQCIGCVDQIVWTSEMEQVWADIAGGNADACNEYMTGYRKQILNTVELVKGKLTKLQRTCVCTLIVVDVHARDVITALMEADCTTVMDFNWQKQLRYYWMEGSDGSRVDCHISHSAARVTYGYEYLGNQLRLVITPLTERAFLTCTSALHIFQGAAPQGPAGTGKTESVKDLGKALARQVVVFNCSDGLNYKMMSQMFAGLAQAGAWACFDEFNRIEIEVLSVVAQQMLEITTAIANRQDSMMFDGHKIRLHKNFGVFITMNPGYAGRTELPDNLKALFRPICMMIPDYALIAEIMFFSEGFGDARTLAQKMVRLYSLASQQLSKQDHYDFGMRAVKSILVMAGSLKRAEPHNAEDMILIRAMRDANVPKFLREDTTLFMALISDLFPSVEIKDVINMDLDRAIRTTLVKNGMQIVERYIEKVVQLYETMVVRHGVMLVGQTLTGKTVNALTLAEGLTSLHAAGIEAEHEANKRFFFPVKILRLNPKSITMGEMYGDINRITREWQDGVLSNIVRDLVRVTTPERYWVCFDGPVDAIWIENMNTVLDDNKLLCLVNGERIKIPDTISIMFEVQDLRVASPATVSRCGMVFMEPYYLGDGWSAIVKSKSERLDAMAASQPENNKLGSLWRHERFTDLCNKFVPGTIHFLRRECKEYIATTDSQLAINLFELLHGSLLNADVKDDGDDVEIAGKVVPPKAGDERDDRKLFDLLFIQSFIWAFGGNTNDRSRGKFSDFASKLIRDGGFVFPDGSVFDYFLHKNSLTWQNWSYKVLPFSYNPAVSYFELLVPTTDTIILRQLLSTACTVNKHVLVNGVTGTAKSSSVSNFLVTTLNTEDPSSSFVAFSITFSAQTSSLNFQETVENKLVRRRGDKELGPPPGKRIIAMVDDCNMPQLEQYGASPPIELMRQIISQGGFYDRKKLFFKDIIDMMFIACCGEPGGGKNEITPRLTSNFICICATALSSVSMRTIFNGILRGFLAINFPSTVADMADKAVNATIEVYERIATEMLPTPEKTHYTFNLRDVSKVIQGILQVVPARCNTPDQLMKVWAHESSRVFHDRLINDDDRTWWWNCVSETVKKFFKQVMEPSVGANLMYGSWADKKSEDYKEIVDSPQLQELLKESQADYNASNMKDVDLVLFKDAVGHLARICRVLRQPRGNALLVGVGGSGRHSLCELSSSIAGMDCKGIVIVRNYGVNEFREDVKKFLLEAGAQNKPLVFLLADNQLIFNQMLEDVNNILNIGEVPGLMGPEEFDKIMSGCRDAAREQGKPESRNGLYQFFVSRCRENLHVMMCMSPVGAQFRDRLRMFPSLVNCMTIDWFTSWPRDALLSVSQRQLRTLDVGSDSIKKSVCEMAVHMHITVKDESETMFSQLRRRNYTTPTSYLSLLSLYQEMYQEQNTIIGDNIRRYQNGLDKLESTNTTIEQLKKRIREMQPVLSKAAKEADEQKIELVKEQSEADVVKAEVSREEEAARALMEEAEGIKKECEDGLAEALPALAAAEKALETLSSKDIGEIKTFTTPPGNVEKTMNAVLILLREKDGWATAKACLSKMDFLSRLTTYNRDDIAPALIRKLQPFMQDKEFIPEVVEKTSAPCKSMCMWVHAMYKYYHVSRDIAPKRERLKDAQGKVEVAAKDLEIKQARLKQVILKIEHLQRTFKETEDRKASLENQIVEAEAKLGRADQLIGGLASERARWEDQLKLLKAQKKNVVGTMALAAGCVAYLGPFPSQYREKLVSNWTVKCKELNIPVEDNFSLDRLPDQFTVREWALQSLPQDPFSIENGTILQRSKRWCLMIDPQGQANMFIRKKEAKNKLKIVKLSDDTFMRTIESAVQVGHPVLLENVGETLDAALDPILLRQAVKMGGRYVLKLGEKEVDYDPTFRFYITTKFPNPLFSPELQIKVTIVNFTVTRKGLEDQLLADTVATERADLQEKSDQCVVAIARGKAEIKGLEDQILKMLADATGDILDNIDLINTLSASKKTSLAIASDLEVVEKTNAEIDEAREKYRSLATRGSLNYGVIADLAGIDPMYQFSLQFFKALCIQTITRVPKVEPTDEEPDIVAEPVAERVQKLIPAVTWTSYSVVCRGLFEKDKLLLSFLLGVSIQRHEQVIKDWEWDTFLRGSLGQKPDDSFTDKQPSWMLAVPYNDFASLCSHSQFKHIGAHFLANQEEWKTWVQTETLYDVPTPGGADLSEWHRMMIIKALRPEKLIFTMSRVVGGFLGKDYTVSPQFSLKEAFGDSTNMTPLIFVLSTGTDPTVLFTTFAEEMGYKDKKLMLSLGQDQGKRAAQMIEEGKKDGLWVYLQNCHVYVSWMPSLERIVEGMRPEDTHPDFRLWLTSSPSPAFPVPVLQCGLKLTREPPKGLKANIKDSMHSLDTAVWTEQDGTDREREWKKLVFSLTFFHAIVQERRKFGPLGWNIAYEWSSPDWSASVKTLRIAINDFETLPWTAIQYTIGTLNYGGRVTDFLDNRCLQAICLRFFTPSLFDNSYKFDGSGVYYPPEPLSKDDLIAFIESMPQYETPELFGLHSNANITFQAKESGGVMSTLIDVQPRGGGAASGGKTPDEVVSDIADDLLTRCPALVDIEKAHHSAFTITANGTMISLGTVLGQEIDQFNRLLMVTAASLRELKRAIKGEVVMSATMEMMYSMLSFNKIPENWKKVGYLCLKPLASYYNDLIQRIQMISDWCYNGAPKSFWLPGLFFPQGFITGVFQTHSRKHKLSIDSIKFRFFPQEKELKDIHEPPQSGVYTHGYFLEGCSWSSDNKLCESRPGVLYTSLPVIHLDPVPITEKNPSDVYECPLYKASTRAGILSTTGLSTNFVLTMQLPSPPEFKQEHWINRGVAALCMLDM
ncbi:unnamed protein product [Bodo saltans]|uniref:Dynein heavy chain n=1 Tax=Bodo saltans TaxID=75058 RepID=A0A0S4JTV6_BODSA|nr:unnamed protein product [Bodo saltans]|eukprot:CUG93652.1 unnamed protein product [Bodo saltans]